MTRMLTAAHAYARRGWSVFPCRPGQKVPATAHGCKDATCDPDQIGRWWGKQPEANIGIATGSASRIWVLDIDGDVGLDALVGLGHGIPGTLTAETPSGGWHLIFDDPGGLGNTASKLGPNLDSRGDGGYIVVAPSLHPAGGRYRWPAKQAPEPVPGWLIRLLRPAPKPRPKRKMAADVGGYVGRACEAETEMVATAAEGTRNDTLNRAGFNLGQLVGASLLDRDQAFLLLQDAARTVGLSDREIGQTLGRALDDGAQHPRQVAA